MSAHSLLVTALKHAGITDTSAETIASRILHDHARELAEKIWRRADLHNVGIDEGGGWHEGMRDASILIDPEAS